MWMMPASLVVVRRLSDAQLGWMISEGAACYKYTYMYLSPLCKYFLFIYKKSLYIFVKIGILFQKRFHPIDSLLTVAMAPRYESSSVQSIVF